MSALKYRLVGSDGETSCDGLQQLIRTHHIINHEHSFKSDTAEKKNNRYFISILIYKYKIGRKFGMQVDVITYQSAKK